MKEYFLKAEKLFFYFLAFAFFWQWRLIFTPAGQPFNEWTSFYFYAADIIILAILGLWGARRVFKSQKSNPPTPLGVRGVEKKDYCAGGASVFTPLVKGGAGGVNMALVFFLIFSALSLFLAQNKLIGFYRLTKLLEFTGLYFYVRHNFIALYSLKNFWQWFIAGAALQSVVAVAQFFTQQSLGLKFFAESPLGIDMAGVAKIVVDGEKIIRAYGLVPHPNILAAILIIAVFGLVYLWVSYSDHFRQNKASNFLNNESRIMNYGSESGILRFFHYSLFIILNSVLLLALFFTFSRGVIIVGYLSLLAWFIYLWRHREHRKQIILICILLFIVNCLLLIVYRPHILARYDPAALSGSESLNLRIFYNQTALDFVKTNPLLGAGPGNFTVELRRAAALPDWQYQPVHNIYLLIASENGLPALLAFLAFLFLTMRSVWPRREDSAASNLLFIGFFLLLIGLFDHFFWDIQQGQILFWLMLGLLSAHSSMDRAQASEA